MTSTDLDKLFWIVKRMTDDYGHYLPAPKRRILTHSLGAILQLRDTLRTTEDAVHFQTCVRCKTEIDLRSGDSEVTGDNGGGYVHKTCPKLKAPGQRDI